MAAVIFCQGSSSTNPYIYGLMNKRYGRAMRKQLARLFFFVPAPRKTPLEKLKGKSTSP